MTGLTEWLAHIEDANKGPVTFRANRGLAFARTLSLDVDYTGATVRGEVRTYPDSDVALAEFTCGTPAWDGTATTITVELAEGYGANSTGGLPAAPPRTGYIDLVYDLLITPSGGDEELLFAGIFRLIGRVTE